MESYDFGFESEATMTGGIGTSNQVQDQASRAATEVERIGRAPKGTQAWLMGAAASVPNAGVRLHPSSDA